MTEKSLKQFLDSFVELSQRDFKVQISPGNPKRFAAKYLAATRTITVYPKKLIERFAVEGAALHELAHHLSWREICQSRAASSSQRKLRRFHGKLFVKALDGLLRDFAFRYREHVKGILVFDPRRPSVAPRFVPFVRMTGRISVRQRLPTSRERGVL